jgi:hypothetical protein
VIREQTIVESCITKPFDDFIVLDLTNKHAWVAKIKA